MVPTSTARPMLRVLEGAGVDADEPRRQVGAVHPVAHLERDADVPVGHAQDPAEAAQHGQLGADLVDAVLLRERPPQPVEVAGLVVQRRRLDVELEGAHGRVPPPVAGDGRRLGLGDGVPVRPQRLRRAARAPRPGPAPPDERLAGHGPAVEHLGRLEPGVAAPPTSPPTHAHAAAAAAALAAARRRRRRARRGSAASSRLVPAGTSTVSPDGVNVTVRHRPCGSRCLAHGRPACAHAGRHALQTFLR